MANVACRQFSPNESPNPQHASLQKTSVPPRYPQVIVAPVTKVELKAAGHFLEATEAARFVLKMVLVNREAKAGDKSDQG